MPTYLRDTTLAIPAAYTELLLKECIKIEDGVDSGAIGAASLSAGFRDSGFEHFTRTPFSQAAIAAIAAKPDLGPGAQRAILTRLADLPELITVISPRPWDDAARPFVTLKLIKRIDGKTGWGRTTEDWIRYLVRLDTAESWAAIQYLLTYGNADVVNVAYNTVSKTRSPKIDVRACVKKAWERVQDNALVRPPYFAVAADSGIAAAMVSMAEAVRSPQGPAFARQYGLMFLRFLTPPMRDVGVAADLVLANRNTLVFDELTHTYSVSK